MKLGFKEEVSYRGSTLIRMLLYLTFPLIMISVWFAIYHSSGVTTLGQYSFKLMEEYLLFNIAIAIFFSMDLSENIAMGISEGYIAKYLIKPMHVITQNIVFQIPGLIISCIPLIIAFSLIISFGTQTLTIMLLFIVSLIIGFLITQLLYFIVNIAAVYFTNVWGFHGIINIFSDILGGLAVPLSLFPIGIQFIFLLSPFQFLYYVPTSILLGTINEAQAISIIPIGLVWVMIFSIFAYVEWRHAIKRINAVGV